MNKKVLFTVLDNLALQRGDSTAIEENTGKISYVNLMNKSNSIADFIRNAGISKGDRVGAYLPNGISHVLSFLGISKASGIFFPLDTDYPINRFGHLINVVKPIYIITDKKHYKSLLERLEGIGLLSKFEDKIILLEDNGLFDSPQWSNNQIQAKTQNLEKVEVSGDDSMYLLNTSGSTGEPKIIEGMHKSLSHFIHWEVNNFNLNSSTRGCVLARPSFDLNLREVFAPLLAGGVLVVPDNETKGVPSKLVRWIRDNQINLIHPIPSIFRLLMSEVQEEENPKEFLSSLQNVLFAGEALFGKDIHQWYEVGNKSARLANLFGPSETTLAKVHHPIENPNDYQPSEVIPLGKPLPNAMILLLDGDKLCAPGTVGEIAIKTPFRSKGYFNDPVQTKEKFVQNPLHNDFEDIVYMTGDLGRLREDDTLLFVGRKDSQVKIRGNRVELSEIEKCILRHPLVKQVVVLAKQDSRNENILVCYFTGEEEIKDNALREHIKNELPEYMFPSFFIQMDEFPLNLNGKIDRKSLKTPEDFLYDQVSYEAPSTDAEKKLAAIWAEVLDLKKVGVNNSFYELGGHSLSVAKVVSRVFGQMGVDLSLREVFKNPTVKKLASYIGQKQKASGVSEIEKAPEQNTYELTFNQKGIYLAVQSQEQSIAYNIPCAFVINNSIDVNALNEAFKTLIERHQLLRTVITLENGEVRQKILSDIDFELKSTSLKESNQQEEIEKILDTEAEKSFSLMDSTLFRANLFELSADKWFFVFTIHHIISDGWSREILFNDLFEIYSSILENREMSLPQIRTQFVDYAHWQNQQLKNQNSNDSNFKFWIDNYRNGWSAIDLKTDYPRRTERTWEGDSVVLNLDKECKSSLEKIGESRDSSLFMILTTCINILLHKMTGKEELVVGSPFAGRGQSSLENLVGLFVTVLPLRTKFDSDDKFYDVLDKFKEEVLVAHEKQDCPFEAVISYLNPSYGNQTRFDVLVQTQQFNNGSEANQLSIEPYSLKMPSSKVDITFDISTNVNNDVIITMEYDTDLFKKESMLLLSEKLEDIVNTISNDPTVSIKDIHMMEDVTEKQEEDSFLEKMMGIN